MLKDAELETRRCVEIVQNLLTFSRMDIEGEEGYRKESLPLVLARVLKLLVYPIRKENIVLTQNIAESIPKISMKVNNIQQVFFNIIKNALDALAESDRKEIQVHIKSNGQFVNTAITDSGCGIAPQHLRKIYEPFFTTKPAGKGTGLGLSVSNSIIKAHGGKMSCSSKIGQGTTFEVVLPLS